MKQLKYKNEYRGAIADNAKHIRSVTSLRMFYRLSEEFIAFERYTGDHNNYYLWKIIHNLTSGKLTDRDIELIYYLIDGYGRG